MLCYRDDKKSPEEGACCDGIRADNCVAKYLYGDRCNVRLCLLEQPVQYTGESDISPPDSLRVFSARSAKEVLCYRDDKKSPEEGACL